MDGLDKIRAERAKIFAEARALGEYDHLMYPRGARWGVEIALTPQALATHVERTRERLSKHLDKYSSIKPDAAKYADWKLVLDTVNSLYASYLSERRTFQKKELKEELEQLLREMTVNTANGTFLGDWLRRREKGLKDPGDPSLLPRYRRITENSVKEVAKEMKKKAPIAQFWKAWDGMTVRRVTDSEYETDTPYSSWWKYGERGYSSANVWFIPMALLLSFVCPEELKKKFKTHSNIDLDKIRKELIDFLIYLKDQKITLSEVGMGGNQAADVLVPFCKTGGRYTHRLVYDCDAEDIEKEHQELMDSIRGIKRPSPEVNREGSFEEEEEENKQPPKKTPKNNSKNPLTETSGNKMNKGSSKKDLVKVGSYAKFPNANSDTVLPEPEWHDHDWLFSRYPHSIYLPLRNAMDDLEKYSFKNIDKLDDETAANLDALKHHLNYLACPVPEKPAPGFVTRSEAFHWVEAGPEVEKHAAELLTLLKARGRYKWKKLFKWMWSMGYSHEWVYRHDEAMPVPVRPKTVKDMMELVERDKNKWEKSGMKTAKTLLTCTFG